MLTILTVRVGIAEGPDPISPRRVSLYVSVLDNQGRPVTGLGKNDFQVFEGQKPQLVDTVLFEPETPVSLGILIDISRSMGSEGVSQALSWLQALATNLKSADELFVNAFSDESQELVDYLSPEDYLEEALDHIGTGGQARTGLALDLGLIKLREARNRKRALIFFSAGRDIAGRATLDHIAKFGYPVFAVGIAGEGGAGGTLDRLKNLNLKGSALRVYAEESGADARFVASESEAESTLKKFCQQLKNQYQLSYLSRNKSKIGKMIKLEVKVKNPSLQVRHPRRYRVTSG